ncbi:ROK family transcriptional regulator [Pseudogracilibacillus sp. SE30717A]|uniref:ROK family transcriptional regulator n=1 Tax=Pseudogracilibacillus sp. SE30717A TaxID=3098293 RepID=UPI00300E578F
MQQRGTFQMMKSVNKSLILNKIRTNQPISRAQIAKETKLTPPTVSNIVKELLEQEIIKESDLGVSKGGRKPTMLQVNSNRFYVIGVDVGPNTIDCLITDLSGKVLERSSSKLNGELTNEKFLTKLKDIIHHIIQSISEQEKIIGIGIAMHGVVDVENGISLFAPNLKLSNIPIKEELEKEFDLVVKVENDARAMALGESWFGQHDNPLSMLVVNIGSGVGAGVVVNGKLYHGANDLAGEVGHMTIDINGDICDCGNKGCLQTFATGSAIVKKANQVSNEPIQSGEEVYNLAKSGKQDYITILEETGRIIGIGLTNLIHIINPELIVLGGGVTKSEKFLLNPIKEEIRNRGLTDNAMKTKVVISSHGEDATLLGAISLVLIELFEPI